MTALYFVRNVTKGGGGLGSPPPQRRIKNHLRLGEVHVVCFVYSFSFFAWQMALSSPHPHLHNFQICLCDWCKHGLYRLQTVTFWLYIVFCCLNGCQHQLTFRDIRINVNKGSWLFLLYFCNMRMLKIWKERVSF